MARGVANGEENGDVTTFSFSESLITEWLPIDRIVLVLQEVATEFAGKSVHDSIMSQTRGGGTVGWATGSPLPGQW
ncbi:hypothetical protein GCM10027405_19360 [Arthrobacter alkaliphilus]